METVLAAFAFVASSSSAEAPLRPCDFAPFDSAVTVDAAFDFRVSASGACVFDSFASAASLTEDASKAVNGIRDQQVAVQARFMLGGLREALGAFDLANVPALRGTEHSDGSFSFELRFADRRLVFTIEPDPAESGWHFVSSHSLGDSRAYGSLSKVDLVPLLCWVTRQTQRF
jgi:hypothetical protein